MSHTDLFDRYLDDTYQEKLYHREKLIEILNKAFENPKKPNEN
jgi:hypothetical protein|tara:strand:- start:514 stop:642 length:129 start_codon:yes stop_codon:yes gene_type:complete